MRTIWIYIIILFPIYQTSAQSNGDSLLLPLENIDGNLYFESFSYPTFLNGERHSEFLLGHKLDKKFMVNLKGFYDSYLLSDVFRLTVKAKYYLNDKLYFSSGMGAEFERNHENNGTATPRLYLLNSVGYNIKEDLNLEAKHELQIKKSGFGNYAVPNLFSIHGKYKF